MTLSISLLAMALVGGTGYLFGAFVGTMTLQVMPALLGLTQVDRELLVGVIPSDMPGWHAAWDTFHCRAVQSDPHRESAVES